MRINKSYHKMFPNNCPVIEVTGDGVEVGTCTYHIPDGVCPRHGRLLTQRANENEVCSCGHRLRLHTTNIHGLSVNGMCLIDGCECMKFRPTPVAADVAPQPATDRPKIPTGRNAAKLGR